MRTMEMIHTVATALREKYPTRCLLAIAARNPDATCYLAVALFKLTDDSAAEYATWLVNYSDASNVYTVSGDYFHKHDAKDGDTFGLAMQSFLTRVAKESAIDNIEQRVTA